MTTLLHIYNDFQVTPARVDDFANDDRGPQLDALTELRRRTVDDSNAIDLSILGSVIGLLFGIIGPLSRFNASNMPPVLEIAIGAIVGAIAGLTLIGVIIPWLFPILRQSHRRTTAEVWLRAYENELAKRWAQRGRSARRWQAHH